jgi:3-hydroxyisobutyrate dehydrogenase-like beta-hydroxyacid dehydrogenase
LFFEKCVDFTWGNMTEFQGPVGVAGCGAMGLPMARRLAAAGFDVSGFDVRAISGEFAPRMIPDAAQFAQKCETVISVVRDAAQTRALLTDTQAILRTPGSVVRTVMISSTLSPRFVRDYAAEIALSHPAVRIVDAPMSGAPFSAQAGTLTFMLGGDPQDITRLKPLLFAMGIDIHSLGALGAGMSAKVLNNMVAASSVAATRRALLAADALGLAREKLLAVMQTSSGQNWFASNLSRISWAQESYSPDNTMGILEKDVESMLDAISETQLPEPVLERSVVKSLRLL